MHCRGTVGLREPDAAGRRCSTVALHGGCDLPLHREADVGVTAIKQLENRGTSPVRLLDIQNQGTPGNGTWVSPGQQIPVDMWIPWATNATDFANGARMELQV